VNGAANGSRANDLLVIEDITFAYGGVWAVDGCSFTVDSGQVTGLIGPNGAGKSTLIETLSGNLRPARGRFIFEGIDITRQDAAHRARLGIVRTFQEARVFPRLPVIENVMIAAQDQKGENAARAIFWRRGWKAQEERFRAEAIELLEWLGLGGHMYSLAGTLSGGQRRLLEMARALMAKPRLLLLDEPTAGVFPETSVLIAERVREIAATGVGILLIAHNMGFLASTADEVVVMAEGKVLIKGHLDEVRANERVISAYLGVSDARTKAHGTGSR
jgi:ABC-type branched-subunit amino acid transport system ATPase component